MSPLNGCTRKFWKRQKRKIMQQMHAGLSKRNSSPRSKLFVLRSQCLSRMSGATNPTGTGTVTSTRWAWFISTQLSRCPLLVVAILIPAVSELVQVYFCNPCWLCVSCCNYYPPSSSYSSPSSSFFFLLPSSFPTCPTHISLNFE